MGYFSYKFKEVELEIYYETSVREVPVYIQIKLSNLHCDSTRTRERVDKALSFLQGLPMKGTNEVENKKDTGQTQIKIKNL